MSCVNRDVARRNILRQDFSITVTTGGSYAVPNWSAIIDAVPCAIAQPQRLECYEAHPPRSRLLFSQPEVTHPMSACSAHCSVRLQQRGAAAPPQPPKSGFCCSCPMERFLFQVICSSHWRLSMMIYSLQFGREPFLL